MAENFRAIPPIHDPSSLDAMRQIYDTDPDESYSGPNQVVKSEPSLYVPGRVVPPPDIRRSRDQVSDSSPLEAQIEITERKIKAREVAAHIGTVLADFLSAGDVSEDTIEALTSFRNLLESVTTPQYEPTWSYQTKESHIRKAFLNARADLSGKGFQIV